MGTGPRTAPSATDDNWQRSDLGEVMADEQRRAADEREAIADEREALADEREAAAVQGEPAANARHDQLSSQESDLDTRLRAAGNAVTGKHQGSHEKIEQAQALLEASHQRLARSLAALRRFGDTEVREQRADDREAGLSGVRRPVQDGEQLKAQEAWVSRLREQASAAVEALASAEDTLAHQYAAHQQPQQAAGHRRHAAQARTAVGVLRAITRSSEADDGTTPLRRPPL
ncbi:MULTISPECIES: hypothetical protein [Streptomyces]